MADAEPQRRPYGTSAVGDKGIGAGVSRWGEMGWAGTYPSLLGWPGIIGIVLLYPNGYISR